MSNAIASTLLATSAEPLDLCSGFSTLTTSLDAVAYDTDFTICNYNHSATVSIWDGAKLSHGKVVSTYYTTTLWDISLSISGRLMIGVCGPAYAVTASPSATYVDGAATSETRYTYCLPLAGFAGIENCAYLSDSKPTNPKAVNVVEIDTKHAPRTVTVDSLGTVDVVAGYDMGVWLYISIDASGSLFGKSFKALAQYQTNILADLALAGIAFYYLRKGNASAAESATSTSSKITAAITTQAQSVFASAGAGVLTGSALSFVDTASTGLDTQAGMSLDPTLAFNANLLNFVPYLGTALKALSVLGLTTTVGPVIDLHFPVTLTISALSVNGDTGSVTSYAPLVADVGPTRTASGTPGTVSVTAPTVSAPTTLGITLTAVPTVDISIAFTAAIAYGSYFSESWSVDVSADMTKFLDSLFGSIPSSVTHSLSNTVGSTSAATVTRS